MNSINSDINYLKGKLKNEINEITFNEINSDISYLISRTSSFGATSQEINTYLEQLVPFKSLMDLNLPSLSEHLLKLQELKKEYFSKLNVDSVSVEQMLQGTKPDIMGYTPQTLFAFDLVAKQLISKLDLNIFSGLFLEIVNKKDLCVFRTPLSLKESIKNKDLLHYFDGMKEMYLYPELCAFIYKNGIDTPELITNRVKEIKQIIETLKPLQEISVMTFTKEGDNLQSELIIKLHNWVLFKIFIYPVTKINRPLFIANLTINDEGSKLFKKYILNEYGYLLSLLEQQIEAPYASYNEENKIISFLSESIDKDIMLDKLKKSYTKWEPIAFKFFKLNENLLDLLSVYILYFIEYINRILPGKFVLTGGNSINIKTSSPLENDLDFIYISNEAYDYEDITETASQKTIDFVYFLNWLNFKIRNIKIRKTTINRYGNVYNQIAIDLELNENIKDFNGLTIYTLMELTIYQSNIDVQGIMSIPLNVQFRNEHSTELKIQSVYGDYYKLTHMNLSARSENKRVVDIYRLNKLMNNPNHNFIIVFNDTMYSLTTFVRFMDYMETVEWEPNSIVQTILSGRNPVNVNRLTKSERSNIKKTFIPGNYNRTFTYISKIPLNLDIESIAMVAEAPPPKLLPPKPLKIVDTDVKVLEESIEIAKALKASNDLKELKVSTDSLDIIKANALKFDFILKCNSVIECGDQLKTKTGKPIGKGLIAAQGLTIKIDADIDKRLILFLNNTRLWFIITFTVYCAKVNTTILEKTRNILRINIVSDTKQVTDLINSLLPELIKLIDKECSKIYCLFLDELCNIPVIRYIFNLLIISFIFKNESTNLNLNIPFLFNYIYYKYCSILEKIIEGREIFINNIIYLSKIQFMTDFYYKFKEPFFINNEILLDANFSPDNAFYGREKEAIKSPNHYFRIIASFVETFKYIMETHVPADELKDLPLVHNLSDDKLTLLYLTYNNQTKNLEFVNNLPAIMELIFKDKFFIFEEKIKNILKLFLYNLNDGISRILTDMIYIYLLKSYINKFYGKVQMKEGWNIILDNIIEIKIQQLLIGIKKMDLDNFYILFLAYIMIRKLDKVIISFWFN